MAIKPSALANGQRQNEHEYARSCWTHETLKFDYKIKKQAK